MNQSNIIEILLIEDDSSDIGLISKTIDDKKWNINFNSIKDGIGAMEYLYKKGRYKDSKTPDLILLDLNLPKKNGREVLKEIKTDKILKCIPVIVLTVSDNSNDVIESYQHHANAYITKPADLEMFEKYISIFKDFWFNSVKLPKYK
ncbi:response regulator [Methanobacterium sp.]|uniref:response regulator n=1 Tax=Methanobacterium sp. TaxID=2164 RepID=UPI003C7488D0